MEKLRNSKDTKKSKGFLVSLRNRRFQRDKKAYEIVPKELEKFNKLVEGHKKLLIAIGNL